MKLQLTAFILASLAASGSPASAQTASIDLRQVAIQVIQPGTLNPLNYGVLGSRSNAGTGNAILEWLYVPPGTPGVTPVSHTVALPMHRVGDIAQVSATDYIVVGRRFTTAPAYVGHIALAHLDYATQAVSVVSSCDIGSIDPIDVERDAAGSRLFIVDAKARSLVAAPWAGTSVLPTSFGTLFDYTSLPLLARPVTLQLRSNGGSPGVRVCDPNNVVYTVCKPVGGQWTLDSTSWQSSVLRPVVTAQRRFVPLNRPWNLQVYGAQGFPLNALVQSQGHADVQLQLTSSSPSISPLAPTTVPGGTGNLSIPGGKAFDFRTCVRYGVPQNTSFYGLGESYCDVIGPYAGRENLMIATELSPHPVNGTTQAPSIAGELRIGFRAPNGVDPVTMVGDDATLIAAFGIPFGVAGGDLPRDLSLSIPQVPTELAGLVVLFQFVVTDGTQFAKTDVFGIEIRASTPLVDN